MRRTIFFLILICALVFVSCNGDATEHMFAEEKYTVYFDPANGQSGFSVTVISGTVIGQPADPERPEYVFAGWMEDGKPFNFSQRIMKRDVYLTASWIKDTGGLVVIARCDDEDLPDGTQISAKSDEAWKVGELKDGRFTLQDIPTGTYLISAGEYIFGTADVVLGTTTVYHADIYTVNLRTSDGITEVSEDRKVVKGAGITISAQTEGGFAFDSWMEDDEPFSSLQEASFEVTRKMVLTATAKLIEYSLSFSGEYHVPGRIMPGKYMKDREYGQWYTMEAPLRHGYAVAGYSVSKPEGEGAAIYEDNFIKLSPGTYGDVFVDVLWQPAFESVTINFLLDDQPWTGHGMTAELRSGDDVYPITEAVVTDSSITWETVGYGEYDLYADNYRIGRISVSEGNPVVMDLKWWTLTISHDEGITNVYGEGIFRDGASVSLSAITGEGRVFDKWLDGDETLSVYANTYLTRLRKTTHLHAVSKEEERTEPVPINGTIFYDSRSNNGAKYRLYDIAKNEIPSPWSTQDLLNAKYIEVTGTPYYGRFYVLSDDTVADTYMWGTFDAASGAAYQGLGAGKTNTRLALDTSIDVDTVWESLPEGTFVGSRDEVDILLSAMPELKTGNPVWSSEEYDRYGAWMWYNGTGEWEPAGKNSFARFFPMFTI